MRIRTIKPSFFLHGDLFDAEKSEHLPLRVCFIGLWCASDRRGRFAWRPRELGIQIIPYDQVDFSRVLDALTTRGFIEHHACGSIEFGVIPSFETHQVINNRESDSIFPAPSETSIITGILTRAPRVDDACPTPLDLVKAEGKGREGKGREDVVDTWNLSVEGTNLPKARSTTQRSKVIATRLKEKGWIDDFVAAAAFVARSDFHQGKNDRGWVATIDYLLQAGKATELAEKSGGGPQQCAAPANKPFTDEELAAVARL